MIAIVEISDIVKILISCHVKSDANSGILFDFNTCSAIYPYSAEGTLLDVSRCIETGSHSSLVRGIC